ncbi:MAG: hypothetical protein U1F51_09370 [Burkholderiales bacterium]
MSIDIRELDARAAATDPRVDRWLASLALDGVDALVENAHVDFRLLDVGGEIVPIAIATSGPVRTYVCSPLSQYARYPAREARRLKPLWLRWLATPAFVAAGLVLRLLAIDRVVYVDNWLLATNPVRSLGAERCRALVAWLVARYPRHAIVHRSVNPALDDAHARALGAAGFRPVRARVVYVVDPASTRFAHNANAWRDRRLLGRPGWAFGVTRDPDDAVTLATQYRALYIDRYTRLNPAYTTLAFSRMLESATFATSVIREGSRVLAHVTTFTRNGVLTGGTVGYDTGRPPEDGLYRAIVALILQHGRHRGARINLSGGVGGFKLARAAVPMSEFDAVYDHHLPGWRRLGWRIVAALGRLWRVPSAPSGPPPALRRARPPPPRS